MSYGKYFFLKKPPRYNGKITSEITLVICFCSYVRNDRVRSASDSCPVIVQQQYCDILLSTALLMDICRMYTPHFFITDII